MNRALPSVHGGSLDITRTVPLNKHLLKILRGNNFVSGVKVETVFISILCLSNKLSKECSSLSKNYEL